MPSARKWIPSCRRAAVAAAVWLAAAVPAAAQGGAGVRAGLAVNPDQFYFGGHVDLGPLVERVWFRPNIEIGLGNDVTLVALNAEFVYWARPSGRDWRAYFGGGPAINIFDVADEERRRFQDDLDVEPGFNLLVGFVRRQQLFFEFKVGLLDSPELKFGVGYTFK